MTYTQPTAGNTSAVRMSLVEDPNHMVETVSEDSHYMRVWFRNEVMPIVGKIVESTLKVVPSTSTEELDLEFECSLETGALTASMENYDFILGWNMMESSGYLAYAKPCAFDSNFRVIAGYTAADGETMRDYSLRSAVMTMIHEAFHAFGMVGGFHVDSTGEDNQSAIIETDSDVRYFKGPATLAYLNSLLECTETPITRIPLEDGGGDGTKDYHWEQQMVNEEFMAGVDAGSSTYISKLSYKAMEDTGNWLPDYTNIPDYIITAPGSGCDYLTSTCDFTNYPSHYCNSSVE
jgi:hypothetical protein